LLNLLSQNCYNIKYPYFYCNLFNKIQKGTNMPRGSKASYSDKQKRQAAHIEESVKKRGRPKKVAERIAWATVNKQTGGAAKKKSAKRKK
jgi:hypothetical protein